LILALDGQLSGVPEASGSFLFVIEGEDANGFRAAGAYQLDIEPADETPPTVVPEISGTLGTGGWYVGDVGLSWSVADAESTVSTTNGCNDLSIVVDTAGSSFTCTATSAGGTAQATITIKRDATAPALAPTVSPGDIVVNGSGLAIANATDEMSGLETESCEALDTGWVGTRTVSCSATDRAGNSASATADYSVSYGFIGFQSPVENPEAINLAKAGRTLPFKWRIVDAAGLPVATLSGVAVRITTISCDGTAATDPIEEYATSTSGLINHGNGDYQYNWPSPKAYANTCRRVDVELGDGVAHFALFRFN
jgi:hypothetical protein